MAISSPNIVDAFKKLMKSARFPAGLILVIGFVLIFARIGICREISGTTVLQRPMGPESHSPFPSIPLNRFVFTRHILKQGETLGGILERRGVPGGLIHELTKRAGVVFDPRRMKSGQSYWIIGENGEDKGIRYFVYEISPLDYVVCDLGDPVRVYLETRETEYRTRTVSGRINSSLWEALEGEGLANDLAGMITDLFGWRVDFNRLSSNDEFKVIFEEKVVDGETLELAGIQAARFTHCGRHFYAFFFEQDGEGDYYDEKGNSLQKTFLRSPVGQCRVSSRYSGRRLHPLLKRYRPHLAIDYAVPAGTPVMSVADGVVEMSGYGKNNGKFVRIRHGGRYTTQYLHLSKIERGVKANALIKQGQIIGYVGSTGLATGPHLDFRVWKAGRPVDYSKIDLPFRTSVREEFMPLFSRRIAEIKPRLDEET